GLGNDFIVVTSSIEPEHVVRLCDRHFGIGADGVLIVEPGPRMIVINADGSRPEMCGNGLRCVVGHLAEDEGATEDEGELSVATDAGDKRCHYRRGPAGSVEVSVDMGPAKVDAPFTHRRFELTPVNMGNPHVVSFDDHEDADLDLIGPELQTLIAGGVNVELCRLRGGGVDVAVWERGVGRTLACGTGACAVAAAACARGLHRYGEPLAVRLPGGTLTIVVPASGGVVMTGPAERVFVGETGL
ncbi:MAG: diaminopimelate epimerase, partial [Myxococcales bacterium]|nr:diaminopimelate epimerase [Myxococcales bacterium]